MKKLNFAVAITALLFWCATSINAQTNASSVTIKNVNKSKTVVDIATASKDHSTLVNALQTAGLVDALQGAGPFTVFAPDNAAFEKLAADVKENLLKPENTELLKNVLGKHVLAGNFNSTSLINAIKAREGKLSIVTLSGKTITFTLDGDRVKLTDSEGAAGFVSTADLKASNGVVHVIDGVLSSK